MTELSEEGILKAKTGQKASDSCPTMPQNRRHGRGNVVRWLRKLALTIHRRSLNTSLSTGQLNKVKGHELGEDLSQGNIYDLWVVWSKMTSADKNIILYARNFGKMQTLKRKKKHCLLCFFFGSVELPEEKDGNREGINLMQRIGCSYKEEAENQIRKSGVTKKVDTPGSHYVLQAGKAKKGESVSPDGS
ncbi:uncharacterized protein isoform X4 [Macaca fascicularis]|uniref:uncharacterized protein isoform X4 n=2 Tax=Macaca fascicularis TaxID=9541 RepID=UPI003D15EF49